MPEVSVCPLYYIAHFNVVNRIRFYCIWHDETSMLMPVNEKKTPGTVS